MAAATHATIGDVLDKYTDDGYSFCGVHPFNELQGAEAVCDALWRPLLKSWSQVQRRPDVFIAGTSHIGGDEWVMSMGHFMGLRDQSWLGIPATNKVGFLRYAEFNCVRDGKIIKTGFFCDIMDVMHQAGIQPLPLQTGASFLCPGPATHDGLLYELFDEQEAAATLDLVERMIGDLGLQNENPNGRCPPEILAQTWHDDMVWYGPAGIGSTYTIERYQRQHQYPFRLNLKDKTFNGHVARFAEGHYACFFGWPNLTNTPTGGFLGLPGNEVRADMRVTDVYRREGDKLKENWVIIDLPYWLLQQGLDVLQRTADVVGGR